MRTIGRIGNWLFPTMMAIYIFTYLISLPLRAPAGNMAYYVYPCPTIVDQTLYIAFWPVYRVHRLLTGGMRHNLDRPNDVITTEP